jgi:hypothetical protein
MSGAPTPTKVENDDGTTSYTSMDGRPYKTLSGAHKRNKVVWATENTQDTTQGKTIKIESDDVPSLSPMPDVTESEPEPANEKAFSWSTFETVDDGEAPTEVIPSVLKAVMPANHDPRKMTQEDIERAAKTSAAVLVLGYKLSDKVLTKYRRAVCDDEQIIQHTEADYRWIASVTNDALLDRGVLISASLTPTIVALTCNAYWFGKPLAEIQAKRQGKLIKRETFAKIPIVGWFIRRRAKKEATQHDESAETPI